MIIDPLATKNVTKRDEFEGFSDDELEVLIGFKDSKVFEIFTKIKNLEESRLVRKISDKLNKLHLVDGITKDQFLLDLAGKNGQLLELGLFLSIPEEAKKTLKERNND
jgi:hypothetical protein